MNQSRLRQILIEWIKSNGKKFKGDTYEITPARQPEALLKLFLVLKSEGASIELILSKMHEITSPLAPKNIKTLKMIGKHSQRNDQEAAKILSKWCRAAANTTAKAFNDVFLSENKDEQLDFQSIYEGMCRKRNIRPFYAGRDEDDGSDEKIIEEHLNSSSSFEDVKIIKNKEAKIAYEGQKFDYTDDAGNTIEEILKKYKPLRANPENRFEEYPEVADFDPEALDFFGLSGVPKERL